MSGDLKDSLNGEDVLVWLCRDADQNLLFIRGYLSGEQEQPGRFLYESVEKVFRAVEEYSCSRILLVAEVNSRYAAFLKAECAQKGVRIPCDVIDEDELVALFRAVESEVAAYIVLDEKGLPQILNAVTKCWFDGEKMCPWPMGCSEGELITGEPARWTRFFLLGSHGLARQLENVRTILKHRNESGVPQYVLITGETGTGKSFFTRNLPRICDAEYDNPLAEFREPTFDERKDTKYGYLQGNCASLSPELADALLFGAVKGAYTGCDKPIQGLIESAGTGILFLDEVGDLPLETQGKLLTALEEKVFYRLGDTGKDRDVKEVKCSIVFGTNHDLAADAREWEASHGRTGFRKDLLFRINSCHVVLTPLRERLPDKDLEQCKLLLDGIVERYCKGIGLALTEGARREFDTFACRYGWPGNFRDVKHLFEGLKIKMLEDRTGTVVSAYMMRQAIEKLECMKEAGDDEAAEGRDVPLVAKVKRNFQSPCDANDIDFIFQICKDAQSCADAGRRYYGTGKERNFADAFGKRLAHFGLVFDKTEPGHLSLKSVAGQAE